MKHKNIDYERGYNTGYIAGKRKAIIKEVYVKEGKEALYILYRRFYEILDKYPEIYNFFKQNL